MYSVSLLVCVDEGGCVSVCVLLRGVSLSVCLDSRIQRNECVWICVCLCVRLPLGECLWVFQMWVCVSVWVSICL